MAGEKDPSGYDCQTCGACCVNSNSGRGYVALSKKEAATARRLGLPVVADRKGDARLGAVPHDGSGGETVCVAFSGTVGGRCGCTIYGGRPKECRDFLPGSLKCRYARHEAGLGPEPEELTACLRAMARWTRRGSTRTPAGS